MATLDDRIVASVVHGHRTIYGTDWPVESYVERVGPRTWRLHRRVVNGICEGGARDYPTRTAALAAMGRVTA